MFMQKPGAVPPKQKAAVRDGLAGTKK